jgi:hypothetical protein
MKKVLGLALAVIILASGVCYGATQKNLINEEVGDDPVLITSDTIRTADYDKMTFYINYDEVESTGGCQATIWSEISWDKSTWYEGRWLTIDGSRVDTPDTSIVVTSDTKKVAFFHDELVAPWVRVKALPSGTASADLDFIYVTVDFVGLNK